MVAQSNGLLDDSKIIHPLIIFIYDRDMIEVQPDMIQVLPIEEFFRYRFGSACRNLQPFQARSFDQSKSVLIKHRPDNRFGHWQIRYVEGWNRDSSLQRVLNDLFEVRHGLLHLRN